MNILKATLVTTTLVLGSATTVFAQSSTVNQAKDLIIDKGVDVAKDKALGVVPDSTTQFVDPAAQAGKDLMNGASATDAISGAVSSQSAPATTGLNVGDLGSAAGIGGVGSSLPSVGGLGSTADIGGVGGSLPNVGGITDTTLSADESLTAGKILLKGGSTTDVATAVVKDRATNSLKDTANGLVTNGVGSGTTFGTVPTAPTTQDLGSGTTYGTTTSTGAPVLSAPAPSAVTVNCPSGTTAQADGTCLVTGDF